ncbi:MAG: HAD family phosphatase [Planctomycetes bacterium]|nr:HAD family phosphatase [Planctomycetota bacterium]
MPSAATAILWDLDGTLVDSEPLHRRAILEALAARGADPTALDPRDFVGRGERDFWLFCKDRFSLAEPVEALVDHKDSIYTEMVRVELQVMPGAIDCLEQFAAARKPMAIASGSSPRAIAAAVSAVGLGHYFRELVSSLDPAVRRSKPHPDVFLEAARRLGVDPRECLVIEDAQWGVRAAVAAGMRVIVVPNSWTRDHDFSGAEKVLKSLAELK